MNIISPYLKDSLRAFGFNQFGFVDMKQRCQIGIGLAKWLQCYAVSHAKGEHRISVQNLKIGAVLPEEPDNSGRTCKKPWLIWFSYRPGVVGILRGRQKSQMDSVS